jgi:hypothetical protein
VSTSGLVHTCFLVDYWNMMVVICNMCIRVMSHNTFCYLINVCKLKINVCRLIVFCVLSCFIARIPPLMNYDA